MFFCFLLQFVPNYVNGRLARFGQSRLVGADGGRGHDSVLILGQNRNKIPLFFRYFQLDQPFFHGFSGSIRRVEAVPRFSAADGENVRFFGG